jgi:hypothetical protein
MGAFVVRRGLMKVRNQPKLRRVLKVHPFSYFHENTSRTSIPVCTTIYTPIHMTLCDLLLHMREVCCWGINISADGKPACSRTRILTDSARKINRKEVLANYNKTRINIGNQHDCWMELKVALRVQTQRKCKHQCHWACSSEIGTYIFNDAGRQTAHKKQRKYIFWSNLAKRHLILMFWRNILKFNAKKK